MRPLSPSSQRVPGSVPGSGRAEKVVSRCVRLSPRCAFCRCAGSTLHTPRPPPAPLSSSSPRAPPCKAAPGPARASRRFRPSDAQPGERRAIGARGAGRAGPGRARTLGAAHAGPTLRRAGCVAPSPPRYREAAERALCPRARPGLCPEEAAAPSPRLRLCPRAGRAGRGGGSQAEGEGGGGGGLRRRGGQQRRRERRVPGRGSRGLSGRRG